MKNLQQIFQGLAASATILLFAQCAGNNADMSATGTSSVDTCGLSVAYVDMDSLLTHYNLATDFSEAMMSKEENVRATLNEKGRQLQKEGEDFQRKLQNNAFVSRARAEQEQKRILNKQQKLQGLQQRLQNELVSEQQKNSLELRDSIKSFLKFFNLNKKYSLILSNTGMDNILLADPALDITNEVVEGLNARYNPTIAVTKK